MKSSELPAGWVIKPLSEVAEVKLGRQRSPKNHSGPFMRPYLRAANVTWGGLSLHDVKEMNFGPSELETFRLEPGDVLVAEASGSRSEVGKAAIWRGEIQDCCFQNTLLRVRSREPLPEFLLLILRHAAVTGRFGNAARGVGIHHLGAKALSEWPITLPPEDEQREIVAEIDRHIPRLDAAALRRTQGNLRRYRASVLHVACTGQLAGHGLGEEWEKATVNELAEFVQYGTSAKMQEEGPGVPVLRMGNIDSQGTLRLDNLKFLPLDHDDFPGLLLQPGDVLFNRTNSAELVGKSAVYRGDPSPCSFASYLIRVRLAPGYMPEFLVYYINSRFGRAWIRSVVSQQVGQANVSGGKLKSLEVPVPPLSEQKRIVAEAERQFSVLNKIEVAVNADLGRSQSLRQSLLSKAVSGRLVTNENAIGSLSGR